MNMFNLSIEEDWRKIKMVKVTVEENGQTEAKLGGEFVLAATFEKIEDRSKGDLTQTSELDAGR